MIVRRNVPLLYVIALLQGFIFFIPIYALYLEQELFSVLNVGIIIAISGLTAALLEIPGGVVADRFGRKNTIVVASFLLLLEILVLAIGGHFGMFVLFAVLQGITISLFSGTEEALIYDTLAEMGEQKRFKRVLAVLFTIWPASAALGSFLGGFMAVMSLRIPIFASLIPIGIVFVLSLFLVEPKYHASNTSILRHVREGVRIVFTNRQVLLVTLVGLVLFSFGDISETFKPLFFAYKDIPLTFFGILFGVTFILSAIGSFSTQWLTERFGNRRMLLFALLLSPALLLVATRLPGMWAGAFVVAGSVLWGLELIIMSIVINEELASAHRATVLSISNLIRKLGVIVTALVFGLITDVFSINTTFVIVALCSFSAFFLAILLRGDAQPAGQS